MKRKNLIFVSLILIMILALSLSACSLFGGGDENPDPNTEQGGTPGGDPDTGEGEGGGEPEIEIHWSYPVFEINVISETEAECIATRHNIDDETQTQSVTVKCVVTREEPTFELDGSITYEATFDEEWVKHYTHVDHLPAYTLTFVPSEPNTVNKEGNIAYYAGSNGKYYADKDHTEEITLESTVLPKIVPDYIAAEAPTYAEVGCIEHYEANGRYYIKEGDVYKNVIREKIEIPSLDGNTNFYDERGYNFDSKKHKSSTKLDIETIINDFKLNGYYDVTYYKSNEFIDSNKILDLDKYIKDNQNTDIYCLFTYKLTFDNNEVVICKYKEPIGKIPTPAEKAGLTFNHYYSYDLSCDNVTAETIFGNLKNCSATATYFDSGIQYSELNENDVEITGYNGTNTEVTIPAMLKGKKVVGIADNAFADNTTITKVNLQGEGTYIGNKAFYNCTSLKTVYLPRTMLEIGNYAFFNTGIESFTLEDKITSVGDYAFANCANLYDLDLNGELITIGNFAFKDCTNLTEVILPEGLENIGIGIVMGCTKLGTLRMPYYCNGVFRSDFGSGETNNIVYIGKEPYQTNPIDGVTYTISYYTDVTGINYNYVPSNTKEIAPYAYAGVPISRIIINENISKIGDYAFMGCGLSNQFGYSQSDLLDIDSYNYVTPEKGAFFRDYKHNSDLTLGKGVFKNNNFEEAYIHNFIVGILPSELFMDNPNFRHLSVYENEKIDTIDAHITNSQAQTFELNLREFKGYINPKSFENVPLYNYYGPMDTLNITNTSNLRDLGIYGTTKVKAGIITNAKNIWEIIVDDSVPEIENGAFDNLTPYYIGIGNNVICSDNILNNVVSKVGTYSGPTRLYLNFYDYLEKNSNDTGIKRIYLSGSGQPKFDNLTDLVYINLNDGIFDNLTAIGCKKIETIICNGLFKMKDRESFADSYKATIQVALNAEANNIYQGFWLNAGSDGTRYNNVVYSATGLESIERNYKYIKAGDKIVLTSYNGYSEDIVTIPTKLDGYDILGYLCYIHNDSVKKMAFPDTMTEIQPYLANYTDMNYLDLNNVTHVGKNAFERCNIHAAVDVSKLVKIDDYAFADNSFFELNLISAEIIGNSAFTGNGEATTLNFGNNLKSIGSSAFVNSYKIKNLVLPDYDLTIGDHAFAYSKIQSIDFGTKLTKIPDYMFADNELKSLTIPASVKTIGNHAFDKCSIYTPEGETAPRPFRFDVIISAGSQLTSIGEFAFNESGIKSITIPNSVTFIGKDAFFFKANRNFDAIPCNITVDNSEAYCSANFDPGWNHSYNEYQTEKPKYYTVTYLR